MPFFEVVEEDNMWSVESLKLRTVFIDKTDNTFIQFFRYTFVGGFAFCVDFSTLFFLTEYMHIHYLYSAAIAFILGLAVNYFLSVLWVFNQRTMKNRLLEFLLFVFVGIIGLGLNELFIWVLTDIFLVYYLLSKIITGVVVYFWNFLARKLILFNNQKITQ